ncbi:acyl-CoA dehydrogenase family member 11-like isoform X2 [Corticium candelabrum]|uniref:acyl-CoA dehydrogenase family member 11-like isoform X2 n=2 Tax=Corticium candelabrum TaxID=121492 RepID=UPI002E265E10|nr:acyl-CoA dehydrogenase family member 11-like isoform X2 [Corticium candelabrum]
MDEKVYPAEKVFVSQLESAPSRWTVLPIIEQLKSEAKRQGLWNLFLPDISGLSQLEYAHLAEVMGRSPGIAPEAFNCSAPDTGNMEVLHMYGSNEQKRQWLEPLLDGRIRSVFCMTEPAVASSDATNMECTIEKNGDHYVINGRKWWSSGAGDPRCKIAVLMGRTGSDDMPKHKQHSMILVPMDSPGVQKIRPLHVFGYDEAPHGHFEIKFENVRVPVSNMILGEGRGFEIAQGRLGPGRIHHCMRLIGMSERAVDMMCKRAISRTAFGKPIARQGVVQHQIAQSRIEIEQARLLTLNAADTIDKYGTKVARAEIAMIKVVAPQIAQAIVDRAIQIHGGAGVCQDTPLPMFFSYARSIRIADGPDEVHFASVAKHELKKHLGARL